MKLNAIPDAHIAGQIAALAAGNPVPYSEDLAHGLTVRELPHEVRDGTIRLTAPLELLDQEALCASLPFPVEVHFAIDSTNSYLMTGFSHGDPMRACLAEQQVSGRGRRGRHWVSPFGRNLYMSIASGFAGPVTALGGLSIAVGIELATILRERGLAEVGLKWPNDVVVPGGKLCGILVELGPAMQGIVPVVAGIGINMALTPGQAEAIDQPWAAVQDEIDVSRNALAQEVLGRVGGLLARFDSDVFASYRARWEAFDVHAGRLVQLRRGETVIEGLSHGIDSTGNLKVLCDDEIRLFDAGEVSLRKAD